MTQIAAEGLYTEKWYNTENVTNYGYILHENRLLGAVQMRQKQVTNDSCLVAEDFKEEILFCYNSYAPIYENKLPFGPCNGVPAENCTAEGYEG